jgi:hypothetical protein
MLIALAFIIVIIVYMGLSAVLWFLLQGTAEPISYLEALGWFPQAILRLLEEMLENMEKW